MFYTLYAWQQTAMAPLRLAAVTGQHFFSASTFPFVETRTARAIAAACEMVERSTRSYGKPPFGIDAVPVNGHAVPVSEEIVAGNAFGSLIRFKREGAERHPRVMLVAPLSGHHSTLLRGTVAALLPGHDVHITDWHDAKDIPVAAGRFDAYWEQSVAAWDMAAGALLISEAGGVVSDTAGHQLDVRGGTFLGCTPKIHAALLEALAPESA